jgi:hypothetical protein
MAIKPKFTYSDIEKALNAELINIEKGVIRIMRRCGEDFVNEAREAINISGAFPKGNYHDDTENLRNSIGFFVMRDNEVVCGDGNSDARVVLSQLDSKAGYTLIGVAGRDYASYVESKGYNVITSQQYVCYVNLGVMLQKFTKQLSKKGVNIDFTTYF